MNKVNSLKKIAELTENDMRVFLSLIFNEELTYSKEEAIAEFDNSIENTLEESYFRHLIEPKLRNVVDEMIEKLTQRKLNQEYE